MLETKILNKPYLTSKPCQFILLSRLLSHMLGASSLETTGNEMFAVIKVEAVEPGGESNVSQMGIQLQEEKGISFRPLVTSTM